MTHTHKMLAVILRIASNEINAYSNRFLTLRPLSWYSQKPTQYLQLTCPKTNKHLIFLQTWSSIFPKTWGKNLGQNFNAVTHSFLSHPHAIQREIPVAVPLKYIHDTTTSHAVCCLRRAAGHHRPLSALVIGLLTCRPVSGLLLTMCFQRGR